MKEIQDLILGDGVTWTMFAAYYIMGMVGLFVSALTDIYSSGIESNQFLFRIFWRENKIRLILSFVVIAVGVVFSEQLIGSKLTTWTAFLSGFMSDKVIENLMQRRKKRLNVEK
jgi:hypothetical protein